MAKNVTSVTFLSSILRFSNVEFQVDAYEVLVEVNFPTRWIYQAIQPVAVVPSPTPIVPTKIRTSFA